jgi:hypothetical protein
MNEPTRNRTVFLALAALASISGRAPAQMTCQPTAITILTGGCTEDVVVTGDPFVHITPTTIPAGVEVDPKIGMAANFAGQAFFKISCTAPGGPADVIFTSSSGGCTVSVTCLPQVVNYCVPGWTANGCGTNLPPFPPDPTFVCNVGCPPLNISAVGVPSRTKPTGFTLTVTWAPANRAGLYYWGANGRQMNQWGNGTSFKCIVPPFMGRGALLASGPMTVQCTGVFMEDLNERWTSKPMTRPQMGDIVQAQLWFRDPHNTSNVTTAFSDAVEFCVSQ